MKVLVDNQLPLQLAVHLRAWGFDALHVLEIGLQEATDIELWLRAGQESRIVISKDEDFAFLANRAGDTGRLIWVRLGNCRNAALIASFDGAKQLLVHALQSGQRIIELR